MQLNKWLKKLYNFIDTHNSMGLDAVSRPLVLCLLYIKEKLGNQLTKVRLTLKETGSAENQH